MAMRRIELDAKDWRIVLDYYDALKEALGAHPEHGDSLDACVDSMIYGGMNQVEAPYVVRITGTADCSAMLISASRSSLSKRLLPKSGAQADFRN